MSYTKRSHLYTFPIPGNLYPSNRLHFHGDWEAVTTQIRYRSITRGVCGWEASVVMVDSFRTRCSAAAIPAAARSQCCFVENVTAAACVPCARLLGTCTRLTELERKYDYWSVCVCLVYIHTYICAAYKDVLYTEQRLRSPGVVCLCLFGRFHLPPNATSIV